MDIPVDNRRFLEILLWICYGFSKHKAAYSADEKDAASRLNLE